PMDQAFYHAQGVAAGIYSQIGVKLRWRRAGAQPPKSRTTCTIAVAFSWKTPPNWHPGAMAFSNPFALDGAAVTVFMDRLAPMVNDNPMAAAILLGHVLAHEMGHILQGIMRHSDTGVLKERWSETEIRRMQVERLRFTDH